MPDFATIRGLADELDGEAAKFRRFFRTTEARWTVDRASEDQRVEVERQPAAQAWSMVVGPAQHYAVLMRQRGGEFAIGDSVQRLERIVALDTPERFDAVETHADELWAALTDAATEIRQSATP